MLGKPVSDFSLLSTTPTNNISSFGVMKLKNAYGKRSAASSAAPSSIEGELARAWRGVKVPSHVEEVLSFAKAL
jgi:thioredoxin-dependent peroxiredoxin